tara:strand:+ start:219 stop:458 length:240 start_codon:yes stop_codon:yes gene_type:complete
MIEEGIKLMFMGMGFVFSFLILLVVLMKVSGVVLNLGSEENGSGKLDDEMASPGIGTTGRSIQKIAAAVAVAYHAAKEK